MKGFLALLVVCLLVLSGYNALQIREMRQDVDRLQVKLKEQQHAAAASEQAARAAADALSSVRDALSHADAKGAQDALATAKRRIDDAVRTAGTHARPAMDWLKSSAGGLTGEVRDKLNGLR